MTTNFPSNDILLILVVNLLIYENFLSSVNIYLFNLQIKDDFICNDKYFRVNIMYKLMTSFIGSPKQEHKTEIEKTVNNIDEFPEYFNDLFNKENNGDATAKSKIENINIGKILTPKSESHNPPTNKEVFAYLFNNFRNKFNEKLEKPNGTIEKFIPAKSFEFSYNFSKKEDREFLADCLRNDITIEKIL
ncbi:hypothetical protein A3306_03020 [Rickettsia bellii]|uniref:Uncharacterized protein n=2 Tax=Rickettsia bellii TaxID=33990 RepID=Q1RGW0_RICBR|nr:hypothetical protein [Rickettsia bellii]ABE05404.1 unknown [Rickettsia bellii RML369-C]ABV78457.1 hypothetical protein A1I_00235 [Rickettsia bellii OSU 85-389]ARD86201.1 hypothetical protein A3306_03020 [Rickettsia bellii]